MSDALLIITVRLRDGDVIRVTTESHREVVPGEMRPFEHGSVPVKIRWILRYFYDSIKNLRRISEKP